MGSVTPLVRWFAALAVAAATVPASAAEPAACTTYDRAPACCPHPPPQCCAVEQATPLDDRAVAEICGATVPKGQAAGMGECKRYYERKDGIGEIGFGRELGDVAAFEKLRTSLSGARSRVTAATLPGAVRAFVLRELDERGQATSTAAWVLTPGNEIVHVQAEQTICNDQQVLQLLQRALSRSTRPLPVRPSTAPTGAAHTHRPG